MHYYAVLFSPSTTYSSSQTHQKFTTGHKRWQANLDTYVNGMHREKKNSNPLIKISVLRTWFPVPISQRNEIDSATTQQKSPEAIEKYTMRNKGGGEKTQRPGTEGHLIRMATSSNLRSSDKTP